MWLCFDLIGLTAMIDLIDVTDLNELVGMTDLLDVIDVFGLHDLVDMIDLTECIVAEVASLFDLS